jgi:N-acetylglucosamine-6-phosphate deacetylase
VLITAPRVIPATAGREILEPGYVAVQAGVVTDVAPGPPPRAADRAVEAGILLPGFVDLQVKG